MALSTDVTGIASPAAPVPESETQSSRLRPLLGLLLWTAAVATALRAQLLLAPDAPAAQGWGLYLLAVVLYVAGVVLMERPLTTPAPVAAPLAGRGLPVWLGAAVLLVAGVAAVGRSVFLVSAGSDYRLAFILWLCGLALSAAALALLEWRRATAPREPWTAARWAEVAVVVAIVAFALWLRLPHLDTIPPEVHGDEGMAGVEARRVLHGAVPNLFAAGWYKHPYVTFAISAAFMRVFGDDLFGLRMASVFAGTASILLVYLLCRRLFSVRVAVLAAALLAMAHWHVHFSRIGLVNMQALFATVLLLWLVVRAVQTGRVLDFLLAGFAVGFCFNVYFAARLAPALAGLYLVHETLRDRRLLRQRLAGIAVMTAGAALFLAPLVAQYAKDPTVFLYRTEQVFLFSEGNVRHELVSYGTDSMLKVLWLQTRNALTTFNLRGETSLQHAHKGPLLDFWTSALFVLGLAGVTLRPRAPANGLLAAWFWLTLVTGGILTVDALFSPRVITLAPVPFIVAALVIDAGWRGTARLLGAVGSGAFLVMAAVFLVLAGRLNYHTYFVRHVREFQPAGYNTLVSRYIATLGDAYRVYLIGGERLSYETERFLIPDVDGATVDTPTLALPLSRVPAERGVAFIVHGARAGAWMPMLRAAYPTGREHRGLNAAGEPVFDVWLVSHADLLAANPGAALDPGRIRAVELSRLQPVRGEPSGQAQQPVVARPPAGGSAPPPAPLAPGGRVAVTDLVATNVGFGFAAPQLDRAWDGGPLVMGGVTYPKGLGMHAWGRVSFPVPPETTALQAVIGLGDSARDCAKARVTFEVRDQNDTLLFDSGPVESHTPARPIDVPLRGATEVTLVVTEGGNGRDCDHGVWAAPTFVRP